MRKKRLKGEPFDEIRQDMADAVEKMTGVPIFFHGTSGRQTGKTEEYRKQMEIYKALLNNSEDDAKGNPEV